MSVLHSWHDCHPCTRPPQPHGRGSAARGGGRGTRSPEGQSTSSTDHPAIASAAMAAGRRDRRRAFAPGTGYDRPVRGPAGDPYRDDRRSSVVTPQRALADTSVFIGLKAARFDIDRFTDFEWGVSAVTLGELRLGVLQAQGAEAASRRLSTYQLAQRFEALPVDETVSDAWALLISRLRAAGRNAPINDSWIAATAVAHGVPIVTQDSDYDAMPDVQVIRI